MTEATEVAGSTPRTTTSTARHVVTFLLLWAALSAIGELFAVQDFFYPTVGSHEAEESDSIFRLLLILGMPVFAFVVAGVSYAFFVFRGRGRPEGNEGGATIRGTGLAPKIWLAVTGCLALLVMVHPGLTGLANLQVDSDGNGWGNTDGELVVNVTGFRYSWIMEYEGTGVTVNSVVGKELVIPVDRETTFRVNSTDVIHSFWIPAFRLKIDAIPGRETFFSVRPTRTGMFEDDSAYRVQCAELCGADHALMKFPLRVVEQDEFEAWLAGLQAENEED